MKCGNRKKGPDIPRSLGTIRAKDPLQNPPHNQDPNRTHQRKHQSGRGRSYSGQPQYSDEKGEPFDREENWQKQQLFCPQKQGRTGTLEEIIAGQPFKCKKPEEITVEDIGSDWENEVILKQMENGELEIRARRHKRNLK